MGDVERALAELRELIRNCGSAQSVCDPGIVAELYRDLGVVLAGGQNEHDRAVQAFSEALARDPNITVPPAYATPKVSRAYDMAKNQASAVQVQAANAAEAAAPVKRRGFVLVDVTGRYGAFDGRTTYVDSSAAGQVGGALTLGIVPGRGGFSMAGRVRGGAYLGEFGSEGYGGIVALLGGIWNKPGEQDLGYMFGGFGLDIVGVDAAEVLTFHYTGGMTVSGFDLGLGVEFGLGDNYAMALIGLQFGFGRML